MPSLRRKGFLKELRRSLRLGCERGAFRAVHYSVQRDHIHLLVEAAGKDALGNGMRSIAPRIARAVNRVFHRSGRVLLGRYHVRVLWDTAGGPKRLGVRALEHASALVEETPEGAPGEAG